tara:strand:- start:221 stop:430 length:210 start_codon:yes stop_codon:yes gene_type:complete
VEEAAKIATIKARRRKPLLKEPAGAGVITSTIGASTGAVRPPALAATPETAIAAAAARVVVRRMSVLQK